MAWVPEEQETLALDTAMLESDSAAEKDPSVRIVLADDNGDMRAYIARLLSRRWTVESAPDGEAALELVRERRPTLVITDVMMPRLDGFGLLRELRNDPVTRSIPVIMLSARAGEESRVEGLEAGADDYIVKPFSARELVARVASQVSLRRLNAKLDQHRTALAQLFEQTPLPIVVFSGENLLCISENPAQVAALGGRRILGKPLVEAMPELRDQGVPDLLLRVMRTGEAYTERELKTKIRRTPGGELEDSYWSCIYAPFVPDPSSEAVISIAVDVTEQVIARQKLELLSGSLEEQVRSRTAELESRTEELVAQANQIRYLSHSLLQTQEEERRHIARELHDSAGQTLTVLAMNLAQIVQNASRLSPSAAKLAMDSEELVRQLNKEIRTTSYLLHPPLLDERGLGAALHWYIDGLKARSDLQIGLEMPEQFPRLGAEIEMVVFRVVQECLTNIHRHSGSKAGVIRLSVSSDELTVEVADDGSGISATRLAAIDAGGSGVGIRGMRERLSHIGGRFSIESKGVGTRIVASIPLTGVSEVERASEGLPLQA